MTPSSDYSFVTVYLLASSASRCRRAYVLPLLFSSSFFYLFSTPNLGGHWTDPNRSWIHIHFMTAMKKSVRTPVGVYRPLAGGKTPLFWHRHWLFTEHTSATEHDINNRKEICQSTGTPPHALKFGELWSRYGWERLASLFSHSAKFSFWETMTASLTAWTLTDSSHKTG